MQYVKQEALTHGPNGREARATRLITERASRRIGQMAFEIALQRARKVSHTPSLRFPNSSIQTQLVTIIHKSNVLSVTDGLFRETVRAVPSLAEVNGKYDSIKIEEQLVDSAVYR